MKTIKQLIEENTNSPPPKDKPKHKPFSSWYLPIEAPLSEVLPAWTVWGVDLDVFQFLHQKKLETSECASEVLLATYHSW